MKIHTENRSPRNGRRGGHLFAAMVMLVLVAIAGCKKKNPADSGQNPYLNIPAPPTNLMAIVLSDSTAMLRWRDNSQNEDGFELERWTGAGGAFTLWRRVGADTAAVTITGLDSDSIYICRARAFNSHGFSEYSGEAMLTWQAPDVRLVLTLERQEGPALSVAFDPLSKLLATGWGDYRARLWNAINGGLTQTFAGHTDIIESVAIGRDGRTLATSSDDGDIRVWNPANGNLRWTISESGERAHNIAYNPADGNLAWVKDTLVTFYDVGLGVVTRTLKDSLYMNCLSFNVDGSRLATGSISEITVWDLSTGLVAWRLKYLPYPVTSVSFSPDGDWLAASDGDNISIWSLADVTEPYAHFSADAVAVWTVAWSPLGRVVASAGYENYLRIWSAPEGELMCEVEAHDLHIYDLAFSPDGTRIATASGDRYVKIWGLRD